MKLRINNTVITAMVGDLTKQNVDAIVNAANSALAGGGGVDGAVHSRGGPSIMAELGVIRRQTGGCPTGEAVITTAGLLPARYVIHTVGPIFRDRPSDPELLANCYHNSLKLADEKGLKTVAFCSISTGIYGYPIDKAALIAVNTVVGDLSRYQFSEIRFVLFSDRDYAIYKKVLASLNDVSVIEND